MRVILEEEARRGVIAYLGGRGGPVVDLSALGDPWPEAGKISNGWPKLANDSVCHWTGNRPDDWGGWDGN